MVQMWVRASIILLVAGIFGASRSSACTCLLALHSANCAELKPIGPSFVGTVIEIENPPDERPGADQSGLSRYRFRIEENISGFEEKEVDVYSGRGGGDCSYHFQKGDSYFVAPYTAPGKLVVPYREEVSGHLMASICTETQPAASATALLNKLRARKKGGATLVGILLTEPGPVDFNHRIPDATVELRSEKITLSVQTDIEGDYEFDGVPAATYQFAVKLPADFQVAADKAAPFPSITISDERCYENIIYVQRPAPNSSP